MMVNADKADSKFKELTELYDYFIHNKDDLKPYKQRGDINILTHPGGTFYNQLGTMMEHNICYALV